MEGNEQLNIPLTVGIMPFLPSQDEENLIKCVRKFWAYCEVTEEGDFASIISLLILKSALWSRLHYSHLTLEVTEVDQRWGEPRFDSRSDTSENWLLAWLLGLTISISVTCYKLHKSPVFLKNQLLSSRFSLPVFLRFQPPWTQSSQVSSE